MRRAEVSAGDQGGKEVRDLGTFGPWKSRAAALAGIGALILAGCASSGSPGSSPPSSPSSSPASSASKAASTASGSSSEPLSPSQNPAQVEAQAPTASRSGSGASSGLTGARTEAEKAESLDGTLETSVGEFDRMLLKEQETLAQKRQQVAEATAARRGSWGDSGPGGGTEGGATSSDQGFDEASEGEGADSGSGQSSVGSQQVGADVREEADPAVRAGRTPEDVGDGSDDDIVARQLREAALAEEDPSLRERLWEEYRLYQSGSDNGGGS